MNDGGESRAQVTLTYVRKPVELVIDKLEKTEAEVKKFAHHNELFAWLISPGLALVLLEIILRHTIWRRLP